MEVHRDGRNHMLAIRLAQNLRQRGPQGEQTTQRVGEDTFQDAMAVVAAQPVPCAQGRGFCIVRQGTETVGEVLVGIREEGDDIGGRGGGSVAVARIDAISKGAAKGELAARALTGVGVNEGAISNEFLWYEQRSDKVFYWATDMAGDCLNDGVMCLLAPRK